MSSRITISDHDGVWRWHIEHNGAVFGSGDKPATGPTLFPDHLSAAKFAVENFAHFVARPKDQKQKLAGV